MTTTIKVENVGVHPVVVNVWETDNPTSDGSNVERFDLKPGEKSPGITIYNWRRGVTILETSNV